MLGLWAQQVERKGAITTEDRLEIFGGPKGEHKRVLREFMEFAGRKKAEAAASGNV